MIQKWLKRVLFLIQSMFPEIHLNTTCQNCSYIWKYFHTEKVGVKTILFFFSPFHREWHDTFHVFNNNKSNLDHLWLRQILQKSLNWNKPKRPNHSHFSPIVLVTCLFYTSFFKYLIFQNPAVSISCLHYFTLHLVRLHFSTWVLRPFNQNLVIVQGKRYYCKLKLIAFSMLLPCLNSGTSCPSFWYPLETSLTRAMLTEIHIGMLIEGKRLNSSFPEPTQDHPKQNLKETC